MEDVQRPDFIKAQIGMEVYCRLNGFGKITVIQGTTYPPDNYPIKVTFADGSCWCYTLMGMINKDNVEPMLFYVDGDNRYALNPPILYVPWDKVPVDTKVIVSNFGGVKFKRYYAGKCNHTFEDGATSWTSDGNTIKWEYFELAEDIVIDGITYPIGSK